jgi:hypothetical protein
LRWTRNAIKIHLNPFEVSEMSNTGEELVVLSKRDCDALLARAGDDDAEDRMTLLLAAEALAEEPLPDTASSAILGGDSVLKALRTWRGMTQAELARRAGINQGYLSELESLSKSGSAETLERLSGELDVPRSWLC